jgi:hypothetical protein
LLAAVAIAGVSPTNASAVCKPDDELCRRDRSCCGSGDGGVRGDGVCRKYIEGSPVVTDPPSGRIGRFGECCTPAEEICDGIDNDCDGFVDEDLGQTSCGNGACANTIDNCVGGVTQTCNPSATDGDVCDDADACTTDDRCAAGSCAGGPPPNCDDNNECTDDSCNSATGCVNSNNTSPCTDTATGDCFVAVCDGSGACDQGGGFENSGYACGDQSDTVCDNPNTCDATGTCLENHEPATVNCGDAGTQCTNQDTCDPATGQCKDNGYKSDCNAAECNGSGACDQSGGFEALNTACGDQGDTICDNPNTCDATGTCLENHEPATVNCGDAGTQCTNQDTCDPATGQCKDNGYKSATRATPTATPRTPATRRAAA